VLTGAPRVAIDPICAVPLPDSNVCGTRGKAAAARTPSVPVTVGRYAAPRLKSLSHAPKSPFGVRRVGCGYCILIDGTPTTGGMGRTYSLKPTQRVVADRAVGSSYVRYSMSPSPPRRGRLVVEDGVGRERRTAEFGRIDRLARLVIVGSTGSVTLSATKWLTDTGAALIHFDHAGTLQTTTGHTGSDNPALRRAQARALTGRSASRSVGTSWPPSSPGSETLPRR
jgi:hypothetical protein